MRKGCRCEFTVKGLDPFPIYMLYRDQAVPATRGDAGRIQQSIDRTYAAFAHFTIKLVTHNKRQQQVSIDRWKDYGISVVIDHETQPDGMVMPSV